MSVIRRVLDVFVGTAALLPLVVCALAARLGHRTRARPRLVWGPVPILSNKYWSEALKQAGFQSMTLMDSCYSRINEPKDFDLVLDRLVPMGDHWLAKGLERYCFRYAAFVYGLFAFDVFHIPFSGWLLGKTPLWRLEAFLLRIAKKRTVVIAYGADMWMYSRINDPPQRHALLCSYPAAARHERAITARVTYWTERADLVCTYIMSPYGIGRWDILPYSIVAIDCERWKRVGGYSQADGRDGPVRVVHTPNHRGCKGTEFLHHAVQELRAEGLNVELLLLEGVQNDEVRRVIQHEADILAEQFALSGYALSAIEGMACGLPVMSNLDDEHHTRLFRRYSYLNECPILSTSPETLKDNLRRLVTDPGLRQALGRASRDYVEKYHSLPAAAYTFSAIYDRIYHDRPVDLMNLFHPLASKPFRERPAIVHPLRENKLPSDDHRPDVRLQRAG